MRVPNAGQDLVERRIVREGKLLAEIMLAGYRDSPSLTPVVVFKALSARLHQAGSILRGHSARS